MTTPYVGDDTGLDEDDALSIDEPEDSDPGNAATFQPALEKLADYTQLLLNKAGMLAKARIWTALQTFNKGLVVEGDTGSGTGIVASGGGPNGAGGDFYGTGSGPGAGFESASGPAILVKAGHMLMQATTPGPSVAYSNYVTPGNVLKAQFTVKCLANGVSFTPSLVCGFNVGTPVRIDPFKVRVPFASNFLSSAYSPVIYNSYNQVNNVPSGIQSAKVVTFNAGYIEFDLWDQGAAAPVDMDIPTSALGTQTYWLFTGHIYGEQP